MRRILIASVLILAIGAAAVIAWQRTQQWLQAPLTALAAPLMYEVPVGASLTSVAWDMNRRGLLEYPRLLLLWARVTRQTAGMKAGEYELHPGLSPASLLQLLRSGDVFLHRITFIEGTTFAQLRRVLQADPAIKQTVGRASEEALMRQLGETGVAAEGQFYPDTYRFARGTTDLEILGIAHRRLKAELDKAWSERAADLPLANPREVLILASIVEKETALERERPQVAGVFVERLRRGMKLQTDPTVIYGMGETFDGDIRSADLHRDTPYNTYTRVGLPPTPICLPGAASIHAAVQPVMSGAVFFVANGDDDGSHHFSATLAEHDAAVRRYLTKLRARTR